MVCEGSVLNETLQKSCLFHFHAHISVSLSRSFSMFSSRKVQLQQWLPFTSHNISQEPSLNCLCPRVPAWECKQVIAEFNSAETFRLELLCNSQVTATRCSTCRWGLSPIESDQSHSTLVNLLRCTKTPDRNKYIFPFFQTLVKEMFFFFWRYMEGGEEAVNVTPEWMKIAVAKHNFVTQRGGML